MKAQSDAKTAQEKYEADKLSEAAADAQANAKQDAEEAEEKAKAAQDLLDKLEKSKQDAVAAALKA